MSDDILNMVSFRAANCLKQVNLTSVWEIERTSDQDLLRIPNFGRTSLMEVRTAVTNYRTTEALMEKNNVVADNLRELFVNIRRIADTLDRIEAKLPPR